jgi:hypothetical protein
MKSGLHGLGLERPYPSGQGRASEFWTAVQVIVCLGA